MRTLDECVGMSVSVCICGKCIRKYLQMWGSLLVCISELAAMVTKLFDNGENTNTTMCSIYLKDYTKKTFVKWINRPPAHKPLELVFLFFYLLSLSSSSSSPSSFYLVALHLCVIFCLQIKSIVYLHNHAIPSIQSSVEWFFFWKLHIKFWYSNKKRWRVRLYIISSFRA